MNRKIRETLFPLMAALIWGTAFVFQSVSAGRIGPLSYNAARGIVATAALTLAVFLFRRIGICPRKAAPGAWKHRIVGGLVCGAALFAAMNLQQYGMAYTSAGKAGFITTLYVVLVPVFSLLIGRRTRLSVWVSVALSVAGLYFLCMNESFSVDAGDRYVILCAAAFAVHILLIDRYSCKVDPVELSCLQFAVVAVLSSVCALIWESPTPSAFRECGWSILYTGVMSSGVAFTLQILAQKDSNPTVVSLIMCLESVVAAVAGSLILGETMSGREIFGGALMLLSTALAQIPTRKTRAARLDTSQLP